MPLVELRNVHKTFHRGAERIDVFTGLTMDIEQGSFTALMGPSGSGKSTLLNLIAGLTRVSAGAVLLENREVNEPGPERAVVFQNHSLLPWLTVYENVRLAVDRVFGASESLRRLDKRAKDALALVKMDHAMAKRPGEISGGMKQRVGIARALAMEPKVLLLDEPFGALDALTRGHLQDTVMALHSRINATVLMITHDVDEAVLLADRVVMMTNGPRAGIGRIVDVPCPRPRNRLTAFDDPDFHRCRKEIVDFLTAHDRAALPEPA